MANNLPWTPGSGANISTKERGDGSHCQVVHIDITNAAGSPTNLVAGQTTMSASVPVAIASDQSKLPTTIVDSVGDSCMDDANNAVRVNIIAGAGSGGTAMADDAAFTPGTTNFTPAGGTYRSVRDSVDDNDGGVFAMTQKRAILGCLETPNGDSAMDDTNDSVKVTLAGSNSVTLGAAIPAGTNNIGDVDVLTLPALPAGSNNIGDVDVLTVPADPFGANADAASATGSISAKLRFIASTGIPITGTVTVGSHAVTNAGTFAVQPAGSVAHDGGASAVNPVLMGGYASAAAPADVSADTDSVRAWHLRNGARACVLTAAGALIGGDATNGLDVDVTRVSGTVTTGGVAAHDAAVSGNPVLAAGEARDTLGTAVATGDVCRTATNRYGMPLMSAIPPSHASSNGTPITSTTTSVIAAPSAGNHLRIVRIHISNGGATATWVAVRDGASGTQHYRTYLPQGGTMSLNLNQSGVLDLTTATRLDIVLSAAGSVEYEIDYLTVTD